MSLFNHQTGQSIVIDGAKIFYQELGNPDGETIVCLHGGIGTLEDFNPLVPFLVEEYRLIAIDSRGHGHSELGDGILSYERIQNDIEELLKKIDVYQCSLLGFSDGGIVAYRMAVEQTITIDRVITIGADWSLKGLGVNRETFLGVTGDSWRQKFPESARLYEHLNPKPDFDHFVAEAVRMWTDVSTSSAPDQRISQVQCPLLVIRGHDDQFFSLAEASELCEKVSGAKLLNVPFAGHEAHKDQPQTVADFIKLFMEESGGGAYAQHENPQTAADVPSQLN